MLCSICTSAQQDPAVTMFWNTYMHTNPAVTGLFNKHEANVLYRNQWDKVNGAPNSLFVNYGMKLDAVHGGLGLTFSHDAIGFNRQQVAAINYAYHLHFTDSSALSFGGSAGMVHFALDPDWTPPSTIFDPTLPQDSKATGFDANFGIVYHRRQWNVGASLTHLNSPALRAVADGSNVNFNAVRHAYLFGDYTVDLGSRLVSTSRVQTRTDFIRFSVEISEMITWNRKIWAGVNYRTSDAIGFMAGYDFKERFRIGYNYEHTLNKLSTISQGSHEAVLSIFIH